MENMTDLAAKYLMIVTVVQDFDDSFSKAATLFRGLIDSHNLNDAPYDWVSNHT